MPDALYAIRSGPLAGRIRVVLTEGERQILWRAAKARNERFGKKAGTNPRAEWGGLDGEQANYLGCLGEGAFLLYLGRPVSDLQVYRGYGDEGIDVETEDGGVQVKTVYNFRYPSLWLGTWEHANADLYALAAYDASAKNVVDLVGITDRERMLRAPLHPRWRDHPEKLAHRLLGRELDRFLAPCAEPVVQDEGEGWQGHLDRLDREIRRRAGREE